MTSLLLLLEELVDADFGATDLHAVRKSLGARGDSSADPAVEAKAFLDALAIVQRRTPAQVYVWAGTRLAAPVAKLLPKLTKGHTSTRSMLLQMTQMANMLAAELLPESTCPDFWADYLDGETVRIGFDGPREVAWVLEGAVKGLGTHFSERVDVSLPDAPAGLLERRLVDVKVRQERRSSRPTSGLSAAGSRS
ncbi:MAG: heme NO-binding domain-containing protein [Gemmatimonas sp.]